jgi:betaine-aldehyde dehydrogenase
VSTALPVLRNFVAGSPADPADGLTSPVVDPCTGQEYARAPVSSAHDVDVTRADAPRP